jgi:hypothetical protein
MTDKQTPAQISDPQTRSPGKEGVQIVGGPKATDKRKKDKGVKIVRRSH